MFRDVKKAHLVLECREDVNVELPEEAGVESDECGKLALALWLPRGTSMGGSLLKCVDEYGVRQGCLKPRVAFCHPSRVAWVVVHGDDFVFTRTDVDLDFFLVECRRTRDQKPREALGTGPTDVQNRNMILEHFGLPEDSKTVANRSVIIKNRQPALTRTGDRAHLYIQTSGKFSIDDTHHQSADMGYYGSAVLSRLSTAFNRECSWQHHCLRHDRQGIVQHCHEPG